MHVTTELICEFLIYLFTSVAPPRVLVLILVLAAVGAARRHFSAVVALIAAVHASA